MPHADIGKCQCHGKVVNCQCKYSVDGIGTLAWPVLCAGTQHLIARRASTRAKRKEKKAHRDTSSMGLPGSYGEVNIYTSVSCAQNYAYIYSVRSMCYIYTCAITRRRAPRVTVLIPIPAGRCLKGLSNSRPGKFQPYYAEGCLSCLYGWPSTHTPYAYIHYGVQSRRATTIIRSVCSLRLARSTSVHTHIPYRP